MPRRSPWFGSVLVLVFAATHADAFQTARRASRAPQPKAGIQATRPNLLLIILDDISDADFDDLLDTPNIDSFAAGGLRFRRAYAMPVCSTTRYTFTFGMYPHRDDIGQWISAVPDPTWVGYRDVPLARISIAEVLKTAGYATGFFGKWHLNNGWSTESVDEAPRLQGFDTFRAGITENLIPFNGTSYTDWTRIDDGRSTPETTYNTTVVVDEFLSWWQSTPGLRFGLISFPALHSPYDMPPASVLPPGSYDSSTAQGRWAAMGAALDNELGRVFAAVDQADTFIAVVGDNGTDSWVGSEPDGRDKMFVYEGGINVPFIVAGHGVNAFGESSTLVHTVDIPRTLAELARAPLSKGTFADSVSFVPALSNLGATTRWWAFCQFYTPNGPLPRDVNRRSVHLAGSPLKLLRLDEGSGDFELLFDLSIDPGETTPLDLFDPAYQENLDTMRSILTQLGV